MLPSPERLTRASLFERAYASGKKVSSPLLSLYVLTRHEPAKTASKAKSLASTAKTKLANHPSGQGLAKISSALLPFVGFVVAKKVSKSACVRNRAKRRTREAYRLLRQGDTKLIDSLSKWYAMVFVIHHKMLDAQWSQIQASVRDCLERVEAKYGKTGMVTGKRREEQAQ